MSGRVSWMCKSFCSGALLQTGCFPNIRLGPHEGREEALWEREKDVTVEHMTQKAGSPKDCTSK